MQLEEIVERIDQRLAAHPYHPYLLLVHPDIRTLEEAAQALAQRKGWPVLAAGPLLAASLAPLPPARRSTAAATALDLPLRGLRPGPIICTQLALLFEPLLALDPLALLHSWSRRLPLVAAWPGTYGAAGLAYAVPEHAHYRLWRTRDLDARSMICL